MYGRGHGTGPAPRRMKRTGYGLDAMSPQERAAKVVQGVQKGYADGIEEFQRVDYWTTDPLVKALAEAMLAESAA